MVLTHCYQGTVSTAREKTLSRDSIKLKLGTMIGLEVLEVRENKKKIKPSMSMLLLVLTLATLLIKLMKLLKESGKMKSMSQSQLQIMTVKNQQG